MSEATVTTPGFYDMAAQRYHEDPAPKPSLSSGFLATIVTETVAVARQGHPRLNPDRKEVDNRKFDLGRVAHTLVLGKGEEIEPLDFDGYTTKAAREARDEAIAAGRQPCLLKVYETALAMRTALFQQLADLPEERDTFINDVAGNQVGVSEMPAFWQQPVVIGGTERKLWGRALVDWRSLKRPVVRDYKTYDGQLGSDPEAFIKGLISTGKDIQDPWYSTGVAAALSAETGTEIAWDEINFRFIVQDPNPPYLVSVIELDDRRWSYERMRWAIDRWGAAAGANLFRGHAPVTHYVPPPTYARIQWEERMMREFEAEQALAEDGRPALQLQDPSTYAVPDPELIQGGDTDALA
jgi:hypothetical protein